ncbi:hypothetical protein BD310DRAFT_155791 [Dichomitus squalens]|uniref:Uncharacterized protein n=1 Tax=Dichomitus squalens TaxID=114155 RepID=A0A4Q9PIH7_9APHY|nr:hypothetical protein BD310DRAFT_155791 [Dichomitus squalens]
MYCVLVLWLPANSNTSMPPKRNRSGESGFRPRFVVVLTQHKVLHVNVASEGASILLTGVRVRRDAMRHATDPVSIHVMAALSCHEHFDYNSIVGQAICSGNDTAASHCF